LITLGNCVAGSGPDARAARVDVWREGASAARAAGDDFWEAIALTNLADWALRVGDRDEAVRLCHELERLEGGTRNVIINIEPLRAEIAWIDGDVDLAREHLVRILELRQHWERDLAIREWVALTARIVAGDGRPEDAVLLIAAAAAREADFGLAVPEAWNEQANTLASQLANDLGPERFAAAEARGRQLSLDDTVAYAIELLSGDRRARSRSA
jgi:hypothetical protein